MASHNSTLPASAQAQNPKKPAKKIGNIDKVIKPSRVALRVTVEKLKENNATAERAAYTIWGLLSSWNPNWAYNQEHLLSLKETEEADVIESLAGLLKRKDVDVKLRALGALAQLPYLNISIKATMAHTPSLLDRLVHLIDRESGLDYNTLQLQIRAARVVSSICATPFVNAGVPEAIVSHPNLLNVLVLVGSTGKAAVKHEVIRIVYNLSYGSSLVGSALESVGMVEKLLVPVLDGVETGSEVALRTLWAVIGIANLTGNKPSRQILKKEELMALVTAFQLSIQENTWDDVDPAIQGTFGSVDVAEAHDSALRIFPITAIIPLLRMSECSVKRAQLAKFGLGRQLVDFVITFLRKRAEDIKAAQRKEEARLKLEAIQADALAKKPKIAGQHVQKQATQLDAGPHVPWEELGLPLPGSEEDEVQVLTLTQSLALISNMAVERKAFRHMQASSVTSQVALLLSDRHAVVRRRACEVLHVLAGLNSGQQQGEEEGSSGDQQVRVSLAGCLRDTEEQVWTVAAKALGALHEQGDAVVESKVLKCLHSKQLGVRRAAVGALGVIGARNAAGSRLVSAVAARMVEKRSQNVRVAAACALLEMAQGSGAEVVVEELARRLVMHTAGGEAMEEERDDDGRRQSIAEEAGRGGESNDAGAGSRRVSLAASEDEEQSLRGSISGEGGAADREGVRLAAFVLGQVAPVQSPTALQALRRLLGAAALTPSGLESSLPPRSMANSSRLAQLRIRGPTQIALCTFQAVVHVAYVRDKSKVDEDTVRHVRGFTADQSDVVRESACDALGELVLGADKETVAALVEVSFDANPRVVESARRAMAQIVTGKQCEDGALGSFADVARLTKGSKRVMSASRMLQPLPQRPIVTSDMLQRTRDHSHAFVYWSQAFRTGQISVIERTVEAKLATDRAGIPGWIYTVEILMADLAVRDEEEKEELKQAMADKHLEERMRLHHKLMLGKDKTLAEKRFELEREMKRLLANRPWFSHDDADFEAADNGFFGSKPTEEEMMILQRKAEKEFTNRIAAVESFEFQVKQTEELHDKILDTMSRELEHHIRRTESEAEVRQEEDLEKQMALLEARQLKRMQQAKGGEYGDMVAEVMKAKAAPAEIFVACLSKEYLRDPVCRQETLDAFHSGKRMVPVVVGTMPGMNETPGKGVPLCGGNIWWPLRDEMGACFGSQEPVEMFQTVGPLTADSTAFRHLFQRISAHFGAEMSILQASLDQTWSAQHNDAALAQRLQQSTRLKSRMEWMLVGKNG